MKLFYLVWNNKKAFAPFLILFLYFLLIFSLVISYSLGEALLSKSNIRIAGTGFTGPLQQFYIPSEMVAFYSYSYPLAFFPSDTLEQIGFLDCGNSWISICFPSYLGVVAVWLIILVITFLLNYFLVRARLKYAKPVSNQGPTLRSAAYTLLAFVLFITIMTFWTYQNGVNTVAYEKALAQSIREKAVERKDLFEISNFSDDPIYNTYGKIEALDVSFNLSSRSPQTVKVDSELFCEKFCLIFKSVYDPTILSINSEPKKLTYRMDLERDPHFGEFVRGPFFGYLVLHSEKNGYEIPEEEEQFRYGSSSRFNVLPFGGSVHYSEILKTKIYNLSDFK